MILQYGEFNESDKLRSLWSGYITHVGKTRNSHIFIKGTFCKLDPFEEQRGEWKIFR